MPLDFAKRYGQPVGASQFEVEIPDIGLIFGVDEVAGLGAGRITTASHRRSGSASAYKTHHPMNMETPEITFSGIYLYDLTDIGQLFKWHGQTLGVGDLGISLLTVKKDIVLAPSFRDRSGNVIEASKKLGHYSLEQCTCIDLQVSNFSAQTSELSIYTLSVKPERIKPILATGGE